MRRRTATILSLALTLLLGPSLPRWAAAEASPKDASQDEAAQDKAARDEATRDELALNALSEEQLAEIDDDRKARRNQYNLQPRIGRYQEAATDAFHEGDFEKGKELLARLRVSRLNPYERALVYRLRAYMDYGATDYAGAIENFKKVLDEDILSVKDEIDIRRSIAQLYAAQQKWKESIVAIKEWLRFLPEPDPLGLYLLSVAHYQLDQFDQAIHYAEMAVDQTPDPKEGWLQLLAALYVRKQDYEQAAPVFEELVMRFPKKEYWVQLSLIYGAREDYRNSLAIQQIAYEQGLLTDDKELRRLARSYLYKELPYPAAKVLAKGLEDGQITPDAEAYEMLANAWIAAREYEKAIDPLAKAADLSKDGNLYVRLGQVYMQREQWGKAANLLEKALAKGGIKRVGQAQLLLGISYYNNKQVGPARQAFRQARLDEASRKQADAWIDHIAKETEAS